MNKHKIKAFTLVELIVVITILSILWTISYIAFIWQISQARDFTRVTDISVMKNALEIFYLKSNKYPLPTEGFNVIYTWSTKWVWNQGTFWKSTKRNIWDWDLGPNDPLTWKEYTYSITNTKQEFQLAWILETDEFWFMNNNLYAWDNITKAIVDGTYNWILLKTLSWANCKILSLPSIISSQTKETNDLNDILTNTWLVYNWYNNLATDYINSKYDSNWWFAFTTNKLVTYSYTWSCDFLYDIDNNTNRIELITGLQTAYSWTILESTDWIKDIVSSILTNTGDVDYLAKILINNSLGGAFNLVR